MLSDGLQAVDHDLAFFAHGAGDGVGKPGVAQPVGAQTGLGQKAALELMATLGALWLGGGGLLQKIRSAKKVCPYFFSQYSGSTNLFFVSTVFAHFWLVSTEPQLT